MFFLVFRAGVPLDTVAIEDRLFFIRSAIEDHLSRYLLPPLEVGMSKSVFFGNVPDLRIIHPTGITRREVWLRPQPANYKVYRIEQPESDLLSVHERFGRPPLIVLREYLKGKVVPRDWLRFHRDVGKDEVWIYAPV